MTQSVTFHFTSPQFHFQFGRVIFLKGGRLTTPDGDPTDGELTDGLVYGVLVEGPIKFDAMLGELKVTRRSDGRPYEIAGLFVTREMTPGELRAGRVVVDLHLPLVLTLRVEDPKGRRIPDATVSMSTPETLATCETTTNANGEIMLFGIPGSYHMTVGAVGDRWLGNDRVSADVEVRPQDSGERVVVLRVP